MSARVFATDRWPLPLPAGHRFPEAKYRLLRERLAASDWFAPGDLGEPEAADDATLALVHEAGYVRRVAQGAMSPAEIRQLGLPWSPELVERSRRSVGATIAASRAAMAGGSGGAGVGASLAGGTHHAFADRGEGFCVFNDVAVAARVLQREALARRALVVDLDVHQGNGTAAIFAGDDTVFTFSMHGALNYPLRKVASDLDVELADGTGDDAFLATLAHALGSAIDRSRPDVCFFIAGADPFERDRLGRLALTKAGLAARDALVIDRCRALGLPLIAVMGGGYAEDLTDIVDIHATTVRLLLRA